MENNGFVDPAQPRVAKPLRRPIVGVIGSGSTGYPELAEPLGAVIADLGAHLLTGGGGGVMAEVSRAFHERTGREGLVIGVLPASEDPARPKPGYPNPWVEVAIRTHLPLTGDRGSEPMSRNHINVLTADAIVVLPGGPGTRSEVALARSYGVPAIGLRPGPEQADWVARGPGDFSGEGLRADLSIATSLDEVRTFLTSTLGLDG